MNEYTHKRFDWREDLTHARDLSKREMDAFGYVLGWIEDWRIRRDLSSGRDACKRWWIEVAMTKERPAWQLRQWQEAIRWFLAWLKLCQQVGGDARSLPERIKQAVMHAGARRGLALKTRQTYAGWASRFAAFAGTPKQAMDEGVAREWLTQLVTKDKVAYSTQKQALNALVFFFRDVCNHTEIDLQVRLRKIQRRQPTILNRDELMRLIGTLEPRYRLPAMLQYGSGLRLSELVSLRIKDVDVPRGVLTVHSGKGDKDRITMMPNCLKLALDAQIAAAREWWQLDRDHGHPGVFLPTALARKMPKAGVRWEWFWLFPDDHLSKDPESEIIRRHHLHASSYAKAIARAAQAAEIPKRVTTHVLRHAFATDLLQGGTDIRTLQDLLGHADVKTTEIYAHATSIGNERGTRSPLDLNSPGILPFIHPDQSTSPPPLRNTNATA